MNPGAAPSVKTGGLYTQTKVVSPSAAGSSTVSFSFNKDAHIRKIKAIGTVQGYVTLTLNGGFVYDMPFGTNTPSEQLADFLAGLSYTVTYYALAAGSIIITIEYQ